MSIDRQSSRTRRDPDGARARYIMIGGFLGAGKTTAVARLAQYLTEAGLRVGLITNDQGSRLVDTATLAARGYPVEEIAGGCFCCRFNSLMDAARNLSAVSRPDVFIAEPVGSCTDLVATVTYPLRRMYGEDFRIAPLSVLIDPVRALRIFGLEEGPKFSDKVIYIYRKQIEEADIIVINKCDAVEGTRIAALRARLAGEFPGKDVFEISARQDLGLEPWFDRLTNSEQALGAAMAVDYALYADGEALLGWLNATVQLSRAVPFDGNSFLHAFAGALQRRVSEAGGEVAHLKMTLDQNGGLGDLAVINLVRNDFVPELSQELNDLLHGGHLIVNLRAELAPEQLRRSMEEALRESSQEITGLNVVVEHLENFRPGKPVPTHRVEAV